MKMDHPNEFASAEALRQSEEKFSKAFQTSPYAITITRAKDGKIIEVNRAFSAISGYTRDEAVSDTTVGLNLWAEMADRNQVVSEVLGGAAVVGRECRFRGKGGREIIGLISAQMIHLGGEAHILSSIDDITGRKRVEAERERLMAAIEQAGEAIVITDAAGTILYVNPAFERITGYSRAEAVGQNPRILKSGEQEPAFYEEMWRTLTGGQVWQGRMVNRRKDGTHFWEDATISPVRDASGATVNYVAVKRDITRELMMEDQYRKVQKLESVGRLAGGVAHDLNNLLTPILGYGEMMLADAPEADPRRESLEEIVNAARRARDLVHQLLAFSRKQTLTFRPIDLNSLLRGFGNLLRRTIREDVSIHMDLAQKLPILQGDVGQIEQVVMNLAVNARDAMPEGGCLTIETALVELDATYAAAHRGVKPGLYVVMSVSDSGCGMDMETCEHIFEPFFTTKAEDRGTGLGLATVYGIVKQHGGNIWVYSEPGLGSTFRVYLPVPAAPPGEPMADFEVISDRGGSETILLVEDNEQVRRLALFALRQKGYAILMACSEAEALSLIKQHDGPVHLLLTDVIMPGMNGKQLFERLSAAFPGMKALYMSGYTYNVIAHHGVMDPGVHFIQKPFSFRELTAKVRGVLDQSP